MQTNPIHATLKQNPRSPASDRKRCPLVHGQDGEAPRQPHVLRPPNLEPEERAHALDLTRDLDLLVRALNSAHDGARNVLLGGADLPDVAVVDGVKDRLALLATPEDLQLPREEGGGDDTALALRRLAQRPQEQDDAGDSLRQETRLRSRRKGREERGVGTGEEELGVGVEDGVDDVGPRGGGGEGEGGVLLEVEGCERGGVGCLDRGPEV